jgi:hypothetical protein
VDIGAPNAGRSDGLGFLQDAQKDGVDVHHDRHCDAQAAGGKVVDRTPRRFRQVAGDV